MMPAAATARVEPSVPEKSNVILVVDDNALVCRLIADFVREMGYAAVEAGSADEALAVAREIRPALVLMDIVMPGGNGIEALNSIRATPEIADAPVIAVTTLADGKGDAQFMAAGFDGYLAKPLDLRRFAETLKRFMA
jgi:two-component system, cell cycle response regulator DivK